MRLRIISPVSNDTLPLVQDFRSLVRSDTELSHTAILNGPASIETLFDMMLAAPETVSKIIEAERDGIDATIINCMGDPGLYQAREAVSIPVIGPCEASMHIAAMLSHSFSVITISNKLRPFYNNQALTYGVRSKMASVRSIEIPVLKLSDDRKHLIDTLFEESSKAIINDGADAIVLGCTAISGVSSSLQAELKLKHHVSIPVIEPLQTAIKLAEAIVDLGLFHSKQGWPTPSALTKLLV